MKLNEIVELGPLEELQLHLWLRHTFKIDEEDADWLLDWLNGEEELGDIPNRVELYDRLIHHYADTMPYGVVKDGDPVFPDQWLHQRINYEMRHEEHVKDVMRRMHGS